MRIGVVASCRKLDITLVTKWLKNDNEEEIAPKKNEKDSIDFLLTKLTLKVKFWHFLTDPG